jgi:CRISPR-associated protein Cas2
MRTIVFFDLPNVYAKDRRNYVLFRKFLINEGFIMLQESVYSKICLNSVQMQLLAERIRKNSPKKGIIQILNVTEKQYAQMEYVIGDSNTKIINSDERLVIL